MFVVVKFVSDGSVDFIPPQWLVDCAHAYWPSVHNLPQLRRERSVPDGSSVWQKYEIEICSFVDTEKAAQRLARRLEVNSELESDAVKCVSRPSAKRKQSHSSSEEDDENVPQSPTGVMTAQPILPSTVSVSVQCPRTVLSSDKESQNKNVLKSSPSVPNNVSPAGVTAASAVPDTISPLSTEPAEKTVQQGPNTNFSTDSQHHLSPHLHTILTEILSNQKLMLENQKLILERFERVEAGLVQPHVDDAVLQMSTITELEEFKRAWESDSALQERVLRGIRSIGGATVRAITVRAVDTLLSTTLQSSINLRGRKGKPSFVPLDAIIKAAVRNRFPDCTMAEVESEIARHLTNARDRDGGRAKRFKGDYAAADVHDD